MTDIAAKIALPAAAKPPSLATVVWLLGTTQTIGYGTLYYCFGILAGSIGTEFGWPTSWVFGALSLALLAGGIAAPFAGSRIDRHGAAAIMAGGSVAAAAALALVALAPNPTVFVIGLIAVEFVSTVVTYNSAFAFLVQVSGADARRRITHLTLIAGFASTVFWPLTSMLHSVFSWREVFLIYALMNLLVCLPIHIWLARKHRPAVGEKAASRLDALPDETPLPAHLRTRALILVAAGFALSGFLLSAILAQMVPMLAAMGLGSATVIISTLFGPAQVLVRFINMTAGSGRHPIGIAIISTSVIPVAVTILACTAPAVAGAVAFALLLGFGSGLKSIVQGTLPLALFGREGYGARLGRITSAQMVTSAIAPFVFALLLERAGPTVALAVTIAIGLLGLFAFLAVWRLRATSLRDTHEGSSAS